MFALGVIKMHSLKGRYRAPVSLGILKEIMMLSSSNMKKYCRVAISATVAVLTTFAVATDIFFLFYENNTFGNLRMYHLVSTQFKCFCASSVNCCVSNMTLQFVALLQLLTILFILRFLFTVRRMPKLPHSYTVPWSTLTSAVVFMLGLCLGGAYLVAYDLAFKGSHINDASTNKSNGIVFCRLRRCNRYAGRKLLGDLDCWNRTVHNARVCVSNSLLYNAAKAFRRAWYSMGLRFSKMDVCGALHRLGGSSRLKDLQRAEGLLGGKVTS